MFHQIKAIMRTVIFIFLAGSLLLAACLVFRRIVRRDYLEKGRLSWPSSLLQLLVFLGLMCFPYLYNPPGWAYFWVFVGEAVPWYVNLGFGLIVAGFVVAFGTMFWFGLRRAFGIKSSGIVQAGPYQFSRNPQILGGYLLVIGVALQWLSIYALVWILLYGIIGHMMIVTEEEYLGKQYGIAYQQYCQSVPRYLRLGGGWWSSTCLST